MNIFEEVKRRLTMREAAERYGHTPNRKGFICCPFHEEKTPSCKVDDNGFYCFGCGAHGDIIEFVRRLKGYTKPIEAAQELATLLGISIQNDWKPAKPSPVTPETVTPAQMRQHLQQWQQQTFRELLEARNELDEVLKSYKQGHEDARFHAALAIRTEIMYILDELAAPTEPELISIYEDKGRDINAFIAKRRRALSERQGSCSVNGCGSERKNS